MIWCPTVTVGQNKGKDAAAKPWMIRSIDLEVVVDKRKQYNEHIWEISQILSKRSKLCEDVNGVNPDPDTH